MPEEVVRTAPPPKGTEAEGSGGIVADPPQYTTRHGCHVIVTAEPSGPTSVPRARRMFSKHLWNE